MRPERVISRSARWPAGPVADLVAETVGAEPGPGLLAGISGAAGNPLFVTELLGALIEEGAIGTAGGRAEVAELTLPPTLRLTILRRLSFQSDDTLATLRAAAILGSGFSLTDLAAVTGGPPPTCPWRWPRRSGRGSSRTTAPSCGSGMT